jgi:DNA-directed RNA polymerase specialized sigma24 family protein
MNQILTLLGSSFTSRVTGSIEGYLTFFENTHDVFFAYTYHRTGSVKRAEEIVASIYIDLLAKTLSFWWFSSLDLRTLLRLSEALIRASSSIDADIDRVYLPTLVWWTEEEKKSMNSLHEALWSLSNEEQTLLTLSVFLSLSDENIAESLRVSKETIAQKIEEAKQRLCARWSPVESLVSHIDDLAFLPQMSTSHKVSIEDALVRKATELKFRRMQWVMIGTVFAVMSNVIVASVFAFAVITKPPTSLHNTKQQIASLDAIVLQREQTENDGRETLFKEQQLQARGVVESLTKLGLAVSVDALKEQQMKEQKTKAILKLLDRGLAFIRMIAEVVGGS